MRMKIGFLMGVVLACSAFSIGVYATEAERKVLEEIGKFEIGGQGDFQMPMEERFLSEVQEKLKDSVGEESNGSQEGNAKEGQQLQFFVNGEPVTVDWSSEGRMLSATSLNSEFDTRFDFKEMLHRGFSVTIDGQKVPVGGEIALRIEKLSPSTVIPIELQKVDGEKSLYYFNTLDQDFPGWKQYGHSSNEEPYFLDLFNNRVLKEPGKSFILKMSPEGEILYYRSCETPIKDFKKHVVGDEVYYSYFQDSGKDNSIEGILFGDRVILDEEYQMVNKIRLVKSSFLPKGAPVENHDFLILGKNHYLFSAAIQKGIRNIPEIQSYDGEEVLVWANYIQEVKDGKEIWHFDSTEHPELYNFSIIKERYLSQIEEAKNGKERKPVDYLHINSLEVDPVDGNVICSMRNASAVLKLDRKSSDILWILGGRGDQFGLSKEQKFSCQHDARYVGDAILTLFDNGNTEGTDLPKGSEEIQKSRILNIRLDEKNKKILDFKAYEVDGRFSSWGCSARKLYPDQEIYVVSWSDGNPAEADFGEYDFASGKKLFELNFLSPLRVYRCIK